MSDSRTPSARLDALLTGLEEQVIQSNQTGQRLADVGIATEDVGVMRSNIELLIQERAIDARQRLEPLRDDGDDVSEAAASVTQAMEQLGRWAGIVPSGTASGVAGGVRMAFMGHSSDKVGKTARNTKRRQQGEPDGDKDR